VAQPPPMSSGDPSLEDHYQELLARETRHWGDERPDPQYPQLWDDPRVFELAVGDAYRHLLDRVAGHARVLELGCGDGDLAVELAARGARVTGVDISPERILRARVHAAGSSASFEIADLNTAEFAPESFECVVAHSALHHVYNLDHALAAARRALVPGGTIVVNDFIGAGWFEKVAYALGYAVLPTLQPYRTKWSLRRRLGPFLASERQKRLAVDRGGSDGLHAHSPFEGISQYSIVEKVAACFEVTERFTYCPYWYHMVPKLRVSPAFRHALLAGFRGMDARLNRGGITRGSYVFIEARKPSP
jgi:2-polyprenyl-3-methyl-5-hydroxy-6-metoxy-1,4-benzoquinol methylase